MTNVGREQIKPGRVFTLHNKTGEYVLAYREKWAHLPAKVQLEKPSSKKHQFWEVVAGDAADTIVLKNYKYGTNLVNDYNRAAALGYRKTSWQLQAKDGKFWLLQKDDPPQMLRSENQAQSMDLSTVWTSEWKKDREHYHWTFQYAPGHEVNEKGEKQQYASSPTPQANVTSDHVKPGVFTIHNQLIDTVIDCDFSERIQQGDPLNSKTKFWQIEAAGKDNLVLLKNAELGKYLKPTGIKEALAFSTEPYSWRILSGAVPDLFKIEHGPDKGQMLSTGISNPKKGNTIYSWTWNEYIDESFYWTFRYAKMDEIPKSKPSVAEMEEMKTGLEAQTKKAEASEKKEVEAERKATATAQKIKDLESRAADSAKRVADLEKRIADSEKLKADGEKKLSEAETKATDAETKAADAEKKATDATQRTMELEKQVEDRKAQQKKMENTVRHFQKGKFEAEQAQQSAEKGLEEKQKEVDDLKKQLEEAKAMQSARKADSAANEEAAAARKADLKEQEARLQQKERDLAKREAEIEQAGIDHASASRDPNAGVSTQTKSKHAPGYMPHLNSDCAFGGDHLFCYSAHQNHEFTFLPRLR